ncbi:hypothetical protein [Microcoleus sp. SVA1B1]|uniref:hypothetical protein n=1 Tax=Microcoleus sp. SVA1B1 TaxID=3055422 RepID=UPI002FD2466A
MKFVFSDAAEHSFPAEPIGCKPVVLIATSTAKIRHYYSLTDDGRLFFSGEDGVEEPEKLAGALEWIKKHAEIWAPVIDVRSPNAERFFFADGRHTFVALERSGHACIEVAVPQDRHKELLDLLSCDHT